MFKVEITGLVFCKVRFIFKQPKKKVAVHFTPDLLHPLQIVLNRLPH
ncbi:Uncharacterised protein [Vibrio cholerae]|nr:Uncharacterised protein [Vibrio cholerae]CSB32800.1 Uncharacterised protein [Vibrio cholerae]CSB69237.1 Uncharacterised protein [Vibrio cholerae]